jgi:hypothetical protein
MLKGQEPERQTTADEDETEQSMEGAEASTKWAGETVVM